MKIQSLSIVVPNKNCINNCAFCVSRMHANDYENCLNKNHPSFAFNTKEYLKRLNFARDNGCNTLMITGSSEPQQNKEFLTYLGFLIQMMDNPFRNIEIQTTGVCLDESYLSFLKYHVGVNLISISLSSFIDDVNNYIINTPASLRVHVSELCALIKKMGFSLRISLNYTNYFANYYPEELFLTIKNDYNADQVTIRKMYEDGSNSSQAEWVRYHYIDITPVIDYVKEEGKFLGVLPYGAEKYSIMGMSTVVDADCMAKENTEPETYKYLILRPNCKLYSTWDDEGSLIF